MAGRYRLLTLVATGGMGRVWRAHDELLDRLVAVKEMLPPTGRPVADRSDAQVPMMREARAAARLQHPGVVRIYDVVPAMSRLWIVMEYVESQSLQQRLLADGPVPHRKAAQIGLDVLQALQAAHAAGVVHHDVKPANVLLAVDGRVLLTDFGLATLDAAPTGDGGGTALLFGSPHYVAPERLRDSGSSSARSDLWSLGATLYTAVEGHPPFARPSIAESLAAVMVDDPDPSRHPGPLHPVIAALMVRDPAARATAAQTHDALLDLVHRAVGVFAVPAPRRPDEVRFNSAVVAPLAPLEGGLPPLEGGLPPRQGGQRPPRRRRPIIAASITAAVLAVGGAAVALNLGPDQPGTARVESAVQPSAVAAAFTTSTCGSAEPQPLSRTAPPRTAPAVPDGWRWHRDPTGFVVAAPGGWTRAQNAGVVCLGAPDGSATFTVGRRSGTTADPLQYWQAAERAARADGTLPGYRKIAMGVLLVTGGGADWEYSWQPPAGPRLHTRRVLVSAAGPRAFTLSWTTTDESWNASLRVQRDLVAAFRENGGATPTWAVPAPQ